MSTHSERGMTLVEILIAITLLSVLSVAVLVAMRIGFNTMDKTDAHLVHDRRIANTRRIIENEIAGFMYSIAWFHPEPRARITVYFAEWAPREMRFVTAYSLDDGWRGRPQIAVLEVIPAPDNRGVRLIMNEAPYTGPEQTGAMISGISPDGALSFAPPLPNAQSFVLADRLAYCRFLYLEPPRAPRPAMWRTDWEMSGRVPLGVRIEMAPLETRPAEAQMTSVTVPINITRDPATLYVDSPF